ncbi:MAG TPA: adenylate/guanylate cyclase domain-containing protein [Gaiellaceae bacterium]|nr:adenylate/guanylate cyclase domain-containing protein [Gaiellaceae bacterium]
MKLSETRYAQSGDVAIAYAVVGDGPVDLVLAPGSFSHVELMWQHPLFSAFLDRLASFSRVIVFDKRGTGLSDRVKKIATLEERSDDIRAVMEAADSERAVVMGVSEGGPMSVVFAATHPKRTAGLVLYGSHARVTWAPDYPWRSTEEEYRRWIRDEEQSPSPVTEESTRAGLENFAPSLAGDDEFVRWWAMVRRSSISPGARLDLTRMNIEIDVRDVLATIRVPTLVVQLAGDKIVNVNEGRYLAEHIPHARYRELPGDDHLVMAVPANSESVVREVEAFVADLPADVPEPDTVLATVLFTDLVGSTATAAELGDRRWRELLERHHEAVRSQLTRFRGREVDTAGDGFFATFDGPARAIRCARAVTHAVGELGLEIRAGLHTGECEVLADKVAGIAVSIGARVAAQAAPGEVLVSRTVKDLVAGSGIQFADRGTAELKGVPGEWQLYAVEHDGEMQ